MISSLQVHCYKFQGYSSPFISPISGTIIDFLREIYVDDTDLIVTHLNLTTAAAVHKELESSASASARLNTTGGALNPEKCKWTLADYIWWVANENMPHNLTWTSRYPYPMATQQKTLQGEVSVAEKALGIWSSIDGDNEAHVEHNVTE
jgi:hypothetical protein